MNRKGFTLVEIAVVTALLLVMIAVVLTHFSRMQMTADESAAISAMRAVVVAAQSYQANLRLGFPDTLTRLTAADPPYLDGRFSTMARGGLYRGYRFTYVFNRASLQVATQAGNVNYTLPGRFTLRADPATRGVTGQRSFFVDETGVIRFNTRAAAGASSPALEQSEN